MEGGSTTNKLTGATVVTISKITKPIEIQSFPACCTLQSYIPPFLLEMSHIISLKPSRSGLFKYRTTGRRIKHPWMKKHNFTNYSLQALQQSCTKGANSFGSWIKKSTKLPRPSTCTCVYTTTGASAAQHPLQHNQISCAQHYQLNLHHNADTVFKPALRTLAFPQRPLSTTNQ